MAQVNINMVQSANVKIVQPDPRKWGAIGFYLVYDHLIPKYGELPAAARELLGVKEIGKHLEPFVIWQS